MSLLGGLTTLAKSVSKALKSSSNNVNKPTPQKSSGSSSKQTSYKSPSQPVQQSSGYQGTNQGTVKPWGQEVATSYNYTPLISVKSPLTGKSTTVGKDQAEQMFQNMVKGGYATEADRSRYMSDTGKQGKLYDLDNTNKINQNLQMRNQYENDRYNKDPQGTLKARAQEQDDQMRYKQYLSTGENLPADYYMKKIQEEQQAVQNRAQSFQQQNSGYADASKPGTQMTAMAQNVAKAMNPQAPQRQGQFSYQNFDINGNLIGTTYGESGKSNAMPGASYVKAPNGQIYQTSNFGSSGASPQVNNQVMGTGMQAPAVNADLNGGFYMNPQDYMMKGNEKAIEAQYDNMQRAMEMQRRSALDQTLGDIDFARKGLSAQYDPAKNDLYSQGRLNQQGINEYMGSLGMEGGQNITAQARNNNSTQQAIATVEAQKQAQDGVLQKAAIDAQRASSMEELAQSYQVNAQKIQAILQDTQQTTQANLNAMKEAFQFNYQARAQELARQDSLSLANRDFFYGAARDSRGDFMTQQQMEYEKMLNDRDYQFKQDQFDWNKSTWQKEFGLDQAKYNLSAQKKSSSGGSGGSSRSSGGGSSYTKQEEKNMALASMYQAIDEKLNMVPMGSNGRPQYPNQYNTRAALKHLESERNAIITQIGKTAYEELQKHIKDKPSIGGY